MFVTPLSYTAGRRVRLGGVQYVPGDPIPDEVVQKTRNIDTLLSLRYVVPSADPHGRRGKESIPAPLSTPATVRRAIAARAGAAQAVAAAEPEPVQEEQEPVEAEAVAVSDQSVATTGARRRKSH